MSDGSRSLMCLSYGAKSDVGLKRARNEDCYCVEPALGLSVVCDGMGGYHAGEVASALAVETIRVYMVEADLHAHPPMIDAYDDAFLPHTNRLAGALRAANRTIYREAQQRPECHRMGTTAVATLIHGRALSFVHVGDSRLYLIRGGAIHLLTADHSLVMEQVRDGLLTEEEAERSAHRHVVTRALGIEATVNVQLGEVPIMGGDLLVLCSDGLTRGVRAAEILQTVQVSGNLQSASEELVALANTAGGEDNTTVVLIALPPPARPRMWRRIRDLICSETRL
jgi:serine/threonine protein phosphatase PrpC